MPLSELDRMLIAKVGGDEPAAATTASASPASDFNTELAAFMGSIKQHESGGRIGAVSPQGAQGLYQIMPSNWAPWSKETFGKVVPKTAENQEAIAAKKMTDYFNKYGSWDAVAVAWFAGGDRARRYIEGDDSVLRIRDNGGKEGASQSVSGYINNAINTLTKNLGYTPPSAFRSAGPPPGVDIKPGTGTPVSAPSSSQPSAASDPTEQVARSMSVPGVLTSDFLTTLLGANQTIMGALTGAPAAAAGGAGPTARSLIDVSDQAAPSAYAPEGQSVSPGDMTAIQQGFLPSAMDPGGSSGSRSLQSFRPPSQAFRQDTAQTPESKGDLLGGNPFLKAR